MSAAPILNASVNPSPEPVVTPKPKMRLVPKWSEAIAVVPQAEIPTPISSSQNVSTSQTLSPVGKSTLVAPSLAVLSMPAPVAASTPVVPSFTIVSTSTPVAISRPVSAPATLAPTTVAPSTLSTEDKEFDAKMARYRSRLNEIGLAQSNLHVILLEHGYKVPPIEFWTFKQIAILYSSIVFVLGHLIVPFVVGFGSTQFWQGFFFAYEVSLKTGSFLLALATGPAIAWHIGRSNRRLRWPSWQDL